MHRILDRTSAWMNSLSAYLDIMATMVVFLFVGLVLGEATVGGLTMVITLLNILLAATVYLYGALAALQESSEPRALRRRWVFVVIGCIYAGVTANLFTLFAPPAVSVLVNTAMAGSSMALAKMTTSRRRCPVCRTVH